VANDDAVDRLPGTYQEVMAWLDAGKSADEIATRLGIERAAVPALIVLTRAKYVRATQEAREQRDP
jgi:DNA-directed RNA polymerase specialized sigma24 family protein